MKFPIYASITLRCNNHIIIIILTYCNKASWINYKLRYFGSFDNQIVKSYFIGTKIFRICSMETRNRLKNVPF